MLFRRLCCLFVAMGFAFPALAQQQKTTFVRSPLAFEPNRGQAAPSVRFVSRGNGRSFFLNDSEAVLTFANPALSVRMTLLGQNRRPVIEGIGLQQGFTNYFRGNDPQKWAPAVPHFAKVKYNDVYPGIDVVYYGNERQLEYDFEVHPFRDPSSIQIAFQGAETVSLSPDGDLILATSAGEIRHRHPIAYQRRGELEQAVEARFVLNGDHVGFELGPYDRSLPLTIDPTLVWSSYLGANGDDQGNDIVVDAAGNAYVTGFTQTVDIDPSVVTTPPPASLQTPVEQGFEAFVTKINSDGSLGYTTYFGGATADEAHSLALDSFGSIYVTGYTTSADFPILNGFQTQRSGVQDAYIVKLSTTTGALQFSSYLGGNQSDRGFGVATDSSGNAYVAGYTLSLNFPLVAPFQSKFGGGLDDAFITKIDPSGNILFSTYFGGAGRDQAYDIGIDAAGNIVITGFTSSQNFPLANAIQKIFRGGTDDAFVAKLNSSGTALVFSTYLGGSGSDNGVRLALDKDQNIYVTGITASGDFPLKNPPQLLHSGTYDAFLIKLHPDGADADFSTFIGGEDVDSGVSVAVDNNGFVYVAGFTNSLQFYAINSIGGFLRGVQDGYVLKLSPDAQTILYSSYIGGFGSEGVTSVAVDNAGNAYVTGFTTSVDFPVASNAFQASLAGRQDAFVMKINADDIKTSEPFSFPINGGVRTATAGQTAQPVFGYVAADVASGLPPSGIEIIDLRSGGTLLNEVSIPAPPRQFVGRLYASTSSASSTALTLVNPTDSEVNVDFYFTPQGGETNTFGNFKLPAHTQSSSFLYAQPFNLPQELIGTLTYTADAYISAIGLLVSQNGGSTANIYLPIIDPYTANNRPLTIPQYVDGTDWSTQVYLINPTEDTISGEVRLFKNGDPGQPGVPAETSTDQGVGSVFSYSIVPRSVFLLNTVGDSPDMTTGFVQIVPAEGSNAPLAYGLLTNTTSGLFSTTVEGIQAASEFRMYVEVSGKFPDDDLAATPAIALANSSDAPATVNLKLTGFDGTDSGLSGVVTLPPMGHLSSYLLTIPGFENLPTPYAGILRVTTSQPGVTFAGFRARYNEKRQFLVTATGPLKDVGNQNPVLFPHVVDGGGYATQIIVISGNGSAGSGTIRYLNPSGDPLNVAVSPQ